jgi:hypothetical protein
MADFDQVSKVLLGKIPMGQHLRLFKQRILQVNLMIRIKMIARLLLLLQILQILLLLLVTRPLVSDKKQKLKREIVELERIRKRRNESLRIENEQWKTHEDKIRLGDLVGAVAAVAVAHLRLLNLLHLLTGKDCLHLQILVASQLLLLIQPLIKLLLPCLILLVGVGMVGHLAPKVWHGNEAKFLIEMVCITQTL